MAKLTLNNIASGYAATTLINSNNDTIETALENTLSRDGTTPNTMLADFDMGGKDVLNAGTVFADNINVAGSSLVTSVTAAAASAATAVAARDVAVSSKDTAVSEAASATISAAIVKDWDYRGAWVTATSYLKNNIVYESANGASYVCLVSHTSGTFSTDLSAAKWGLLAIRGAAGAGTGDMLKSENLSGLANNATALSNIGAQPVDADLTAIAALTTSAYGRSLLEAATEGALKALINAEAGVDFQGYSPKLASYVANTLSAANKIPYATALNTAGELSFLDEDNMVSNSATALPSQQSVKAYVDAQTSATWTLVSTTNVTAVANIDFDLQEDVYSEWKFVVDGVVPATDDTHLLMRFGYSSGTVFDTTNCNTRDSFLTSPTPAPYMVAGSGDFNVGSAAGEHAHAIITIGGIGSTLAAGFTYTSNTSFIKTDGNAKATSLRAVYSGTTKRVWDSVRFLWSSGNFTATGTIKMYGLKRAG